MSNLDETKKLMDEIFSNVRKSVIVVCDSYHIGTRVFGAIEHALQNAKHEVLEKIETDEKLIQECEKKAEELLEEWSIEKEEEDE